jgi:hypothetical protein
MTTTEKVRLTGQCKEDYGLNQCLKAIGLPKSTYYYRIERRGPIEEDQKLMTCIRAIIRDHPDYGYRRILPKLEERAGERVNHKRLRRLLSDHELALADRYQSPAPRRYRRFWRGPRAN